MTCTYKIKVDIYYYCCIDDRFSELQHNFMDKHYHNFEDIEENKFIYTDIHKQYVRNLLCHLRVYLAIHIDIYPAHTDIPIYIYS